MPATPETSRMPLGQLTNVAIDHMGLSGDAVFTLGANRVSAMAVGLTEHHRVPSANYGESGVRELYGLLFAQGSLPTHLRMEEAFVRRHDELTGAELDTGVDSEIATTLKARVPTLPPELRERFEHGVASYTVDQLLEAEKLQPGVIQNYAHASVTELLPAENIIETGDGLAGSLPQGQHAGVVQVGPDCLESLARLNEAQSGHPRAWQNVALLNNTVFNEAYAREAASRVLKVSPKRLFTSHAGPSDGMLELHQEMQGNKRLKRGFGAVLMSDVEHLPIDDLKRAVAVTPDVLARGGLLLISALSHFPKGDGAVFDLIDAGRKAFGKDPVKIGSMSYQDIKMLGNVTSFGPENSGGRQAIFVKD